MEDAKELDSSPTDRVVSREELYELVWAETMLKVAAQLGVSSTTWHESAQ
jgi:hypothetical protein